MKKLGKLFPEVDIATKVNSDKTFVWVKRHITPSTQSKIVALGLPGVYLKKDEKRIYPFGSLFSHIVGVCNSEGVGVFGVERSFNDELIQKTENHLTLTMDFRVQHIIHSLLLEGVKNFKAKSGYVIVMEVGTGHILGQVSLPDFNPNSTDNECDLFFNPAIQGTFEHGSTFKILNTAIALDSKVASLESVVDTSSKIRIGKFLVDDFKGEYRLMSLAESFIKSSNIGAIKIVQKTGPILQKKYFEQFGLFQKVPIFFEAANSIYPKNWTTTTMMTASYGYGISVSAMQLIRAVHAIINKGILINPSIAFNQKSLPVRVIGEDVSNVMRNLMRDVVREKAKKADIDGYEVIGKTGTAYQIQSSKGYGSKKKRTTSFIGAFPKEKPKIMVFVSLNDPQAVEGTYGYATGGWNAAEVAGKIIEKVGNLLNIENSNSFINYENPKIMFIKAR